ncbi:MAG: HAD-IA family hydrolase [Planctomycetes bacterium]|nr:HAD-IA family hydrolase [Planctomycetota bacterium]
MSASLPTPRLFTFDIFGTVLDWRSGMKAAVEATGSGLPDGDFDRVIDAQGADESGPFRTYRAITRDSLVRVLGLPADAADRIGAAAGQWPLFPDSREALTRLGRIAPCVAMTNSDRAHGEQVQAQLGFKLADWVCAEEVRVYKPAPAFWRAVAARLGLAPGPAWWHVSAYADYDLEAAARLGLTCVFVERPHSRPGDAAVRVRDLAALADLLERRDAAVRPLEP